MPFQPSPQSGHVELRDASGKLITGYCYDGFDFYPYCHPILLPNGLPMTMVRPGDHPWHSGMAFAWKYLNGCNVWDFEASGPRPGRVVHEDLKLSATSDSLEQTLRWQDDQGRDLLRDRRTLTVSSDEAGYPRFDWHFHFTALTAVACDRHVEWGGYGGFYVRFARATQPRLLTADGLRDFPEETRTSSRWCALSMSQDGLPSRGSHEHHFGLAVFDHPSNPRHPTPWLTYDRMNMQKIMPAFLRDEPFHFAPGQELDLRYRVVAFAGQPDQSALDSQWQQWAAAASPVFSSK
jgi:hypothetical protein